MRKIAVIAAALALLGCAPSLPKGDQMTTWTDPDTGCVYIVVDRGIGNTATYSMTIRFRADGQADCPGAEAEQVATSSD